MKHFFSVMLFVLMATLTVLLAFGLLAMMGCDTTDKLDWERTANQQGLKIGDMIQVEGLCYDIARYKLARNKDGRRIEDSETNQLVWHKQDWKDRNSKINLDVYNPAGDVNDELNPLAPIGIVICTIYNPSFYESLNKLSDMYPEERVGGRNGLEHHIVFTGEIYSFEKYETPAMSNQPMIYLNCVRIHVQDIQVISSKPYALKTKKNGQN